MRVGLRADEDGAGVHTVQSGEVTFHEPVDVEPQGTAWRRNLRLARERGRASEDQLWEFCRNRRSEPGCQACLASE